MTDKKDNKKKDMKEDRKKEKEDPDKNNEQSTFHWSFSSAKKAIELHGDQKLYTCASGVTPSGTIHIGNFREIITVELVKRAFKLLGKPVRHIHSWDNYDVFRKVPKNMPKQDELQEFLRSPITDTPDTFECKHESYADHNMAPVKEVLPIVGINPDYIYQSEKYTSCEYAEDVELCLKNTKKIKELLDKYRKEPLEDEWLPVSIFCDKCKKDTTTKIEYKKEYHVYYECQCGHSEEFDIRKKGIIKLKWRVDWPMRWHFEKVHFEPAGKDHFAAGGSRQSGVEIQDAVWDEKAPYGFMYEWIAIKGGGQFSSSTGVVTTVQDVLEIYEPEILRYMFAGSRPNATFEISFDLDVIKIYEDWDKCERIYYGKEDVNDKEKQKNVLIYQLSQIDEDIKKIPKEMATQVPFRKCVNALNIKGMDENKAFDMLKEKGINEEEVKARIRCAKNWIEKYADDNFKFTVNETKNDELFSKLDDKEKKALEMLKEVIESFTDDEKFESDIFEIPKKTDLGMKDFFRIAYQAIISKDRGPKLAKFILEIGREKVIKLL